MHRREFVRSVAGSGALASGLSLFASPLDAALPLRFSTLKDAW